MANLLTPIALLAILGAGPVAAGQPSETVVTDQASGVSVHLKSEDGATVVTDVATGEAVTVDGEWAELMTDDIYSALMQSKASASGADHFVFDAVDGGYELVPGRGLDPTSPRGSHSGSFNINSSWNTPKFYVNATSVAVSISSRCPSCPTTDTLLTVTLYRDVRFWPFNESYGSKTFPTNGSSRKTWGSLQSGSYYYLKITKRPTGAWALGTYSASW